VKPKAISRKPEVLQEVFKQKPQRIALGLLLCEQIALACRFYKCAPLICLTCVIKPVRNESLAAFKPVQLFDGHEVRFVSGLCDRQPLITAHLNMTERLYWPSALAGHGYLDALPDDYELIPPDH
jgi:hypothetical protein